MSRLPPILRKHLRLHQARRALLRGVPEEALGILRDPCLLLSPRADWIRSRTLEMLSRAAQEKARDGRDASTARLIDMVDSEDPERADRLRRRLMPPAEQPPAPTSRETLESMRQLLADMREASPDAPEPVTQPAGAAAPGRLALLAVDDGGESLIARGTEFVLGHLRSSTADLPFLADIEREHVRLMRLESFHGGPRWCLEPNGTALVDGHAVDEARVTLRDGQEVRLARNLAFCFRLPDPSSSSAVLELLEGGECLGAGRILLCVPGAAGRLRIGAGRDRHVAAFALEHDLELRFEEGRLDLRCEEGMRRTTEGAEPRSTELTLPWPLRSPVGLAVGDATADGPPFGLALRPVAEPRLPSGGRSRSENGSENGPDNGTGHQSEASE